MEKFHSGFVSIIGRPNVGKSTLLNYFTGEKIAIVSDKPQTTRNRIQAVLHKENAQIVFVDTPGIHKPRNRLGDYMVKIAENALNEMELILFMVEPDMVVGPGDKYIIEKLENVNTPVILLINKIDTIEKDKLLPIIDSFSELYEFEEIIPISAINGTSMDILLNRIVELMPEGPQYYPDDMITDQPEKQIVAEIIREKLLLLLDEEVPHGIAVEVENMSKRPNKDLVDISATIYTERDNHKGIIIGKNGSMLKNVGIKSREDIERLLGSKVHLELWVKSKKGWRDSDFYLKNFGYTDN